MKTHHRIGIAFLLNLFFSLLECVGGLLTGSVAILSDAVHDFGDAVSIGASFFLEKLSLKKPDRTHSFGYYRYSVLGSVLQSVLLCCGSVLVVYQAVRRLLHPVSIHYNGILVLAVLGIVINTAAAYMTEGKGSLHQKTINLHLLEDVLGWVAVFVGALFMKWTDWVWIDPVLSILLAVFILYHAGKHLLTALDLFLEKTPVGLDMEQIREQLLGIPGVEDIHHMHVWSRDGYRHSATLHVVTDGDTASVKEEVRRRLATFGVDHTTVECEGTKERCPSPHCEAVPSQEGHHHHHHHHHHG